MVDERMSNGQARSLFSKRLLWSEAAALETPLFAVPSSADDDLVQDLLISWECWRCSKGIPFSANGKLITIGVRQ